MTEEDEAMMDAMAHGTGVMRGDKRISPDAFRDYGRVPDRECFWLVERKVSPPQYVGSIEQWTTDPWRARRFDTEREAHEYWRMMSIFRDESAVIEHMFLKKQTA